MEINPEQQAKIRLAYITCPNSDVAKQIANYLLEKRLCACINLFPAMTSMYWWEGKITQDSESVLIVKTSTAVWDDMLEAVCSLHPYSVPCIIGLDASVVLPEYAQWLFGNMTTNADSGSC